MKTTPRHYVILLLLALLFAVPGLSAYFLYAHPQWLSSKTTNKGELIKPPILLTEFNHSDKWRLVFWSPKACEQACVMQLDKLVRTRLALGRRLYEVDLSLVLGANVKPLSSAFEASLQKQHVSVTKLSPDASNRLSLLYQDPQLFISNPENFLVLAYPEKAPPDDLFHDIKLLLAKGN